jgi:formylglycine-generating enzyme required for sulfatase activity
MGAVGGLTLLACGGAGGDSAPVDAGADQEAAAPLVLPDVPRGARDCPDGDVHDGRGCIPEGWFWLSRWSTHRVDTATGVIEGDLPKLAVYLDAYRLDEHEVTHADYEQFILATSRPPLPEMCGSFTLATFPERDTVVDQRSGWTNGKPDPALHDHPIVCVTRAEAQAYCAWRGGRLPTAAEWFKAGRGPYPDERRYPWGDVPPPVVQASRTVSEGAGELFPDYLALAMTALSPGEISNPLTHPAVFAPKGRSPHKILGLAGNAAEWLSTCAEDVPSVYPDAPWLVRPADRSRATCSGGGVLYGGPHYDIDETSYAGSQVLCNVKHQGVMNPSGHGSSSEAGYELACLVTSPFPPYDESYDWTNLRSWYVGFRCAYDLE